MDPRKKARLERVVGAWIFGLLLGAVALAVGGYVVSAAFAARPAVPGQVPGTTSERGPCDGKAWLAGFGPSDCVWTKQLTPMKLR